ncbi:hypothetical protein CC2G_001252 [Coprinopsis cinerea AmutBmut pab1-1]|nr:hypothetical protein CC2G_001252 [Coprinopsis cinerea AmutBmut pab1-1]
MSRTHTVPCQGAWLIWTSSWNIVTFRGVKDCLEVLRVGGGLDNGRRTRRGRMDDWRYLYIEDSPIAASQDQTVLEAPVSRLHVGHDDDSDPNEGLRKKRGVPWEVPPIRLPPISPPKAASTSCDPDRPRLFHMFWAGPFTDKPYVSLLSFLFTQNLGMHHAPGQRERTCRPQIWLWINPRPAAAALPNPDATRQMEDELKSNPWSAPFLHQRFKDVIQFKLWNTTAQFDSVPELKDEWRGREWFYSAGKKIASTKKSQGKERAGSTSSSTYDRLSVILSDTARFILCHRFGGIYLDADTLFLRDYTELLNQPSAFAYRWSRLPLYNTAVLKLNKGSALGKMIIKTAVKNGMDFHPMSVARYLKDAGMQRLLVRLPDAMFDSAWLNAEEYQIERPPMPYFTSFEQFFETPVKESAVPQAVGFDGFFKGAYSYHFHNFWWKPFDPVRNFPDLGPRFEEPERKARAAMRRGKGTEDMADDMIDIDVDERDLSWATVLKRTFEAYVRGERPNMYGEWLDWGEE